MALKIDRGEKPRGAMVCDRRLYLTAGKDEVVEEGDARASFLFATPGYEIPAGEVERFGLELVDGKVAFGAEEAPAPSQPEDPAPEGDGDPDDDDVPEWTLKTPPEEYLEKHPDGPNAELARRVLAARGSDGEA